MVRYDPDKLDDRARREMEAERERHGGAVDRIVAGDAAAFTDEVDRHLGRVHKIMRRCVARMASEMPLLLIACLALSSPTGA
jgi:hypothetical protein